MIHIRSGSYGDTSLDGLDFVAAEYWPKAIHEGNGTAQYYITNKANEEQRQALINICSGQAKGDGHFALFAGTFKYFLEPQFVDITVNLDGKRSSFSVSDIMDVQTESLQIQSQVKSKIPRYNYQKVSFLNLLRQRNQR